MNILYQSYTPFASSQQSEKYNSIEYLVEELDDDIMDELDEFNDADENGNCPLIFAVLQGREEMVKTLVDQGAFVNHQNHNGETPLYWAASQGLESVVDFLIENGANLNICNLDGISPVHVAAANGHCNIVAKLVRNGAYINAQDEDKDTPLHYAVREGRQEVVEFLIKVCKANVDVKNEDLETPLDLARCLEPTCSGPYTNIIKTLSGNQESSQFEPKVSLSKDLFDKVRIQQFTPIY